MTPSTPRTRPAAALFGLLAATFFPYAYLVLANLRPAMEAMQPLSPTQQNLLFSIGGGLVLLLAYLGFSLYRLVRHLARARQFTFAAIGLLAAGLLALLAVFSDYALLSDIDKQYKLGLAQPEWSLLPYLFGFQFVVVLIFLLQHALGLGLGEEEPRVVHDSNIYLVVNWVGLISGALGLLMGLLGLIFPRGWTLLVHTVISSATLLVPYGLVVLVWLVTKLRERPRQWYDEKQLTDIGKSSFGTMLASVALMVALFAANYNQLDGSLRMLWLPFLLFAVLFFFSLGNLYYSGRPG